MRIGLFSDTYLPTTNGISYVLKIMQERLEELGHEVYIFAPATNLRGVEADDNPHVYRFPAIEGVFFDEQLTSVFFPPAALRKIKKLNLDIIHFFTPSQIGLMGAYAAIRQDIPLVSQYSTDLYHYVEKYPNVLPGTIALSLAAPFILKLTPRDLIKMLKILKPQRDVTQWHKDMVARMHVLLHDNCDAVIALSRKMQKQLDSWDSATHSTLLPTGVDPLPKATSAEVRAFRKSQGIQPKDFVYLYVGRLSREKNLDLLIDSFKLVQSKHPSTKLLLVGDFDYRAELEAKANELGLEENICFTGRIEREKLGVVYGAADVFLFPSTTDTQGLVVHEAAGANLPLILCDPEVSEVCIDGKTGLVAGSDPKSFAKAMEQLLNDPEMRRSLGKAAKKRADEFTETGQMQKLEKLYKHCIDTHKALTFAGGKW